MLNNGITCVKSKENSEQWDVLRDHMCSKIYKHPEKWRTYAGWVPSVSIICNISDKKNKNGGGENRGAEEVTLWQSPSFNPNHKKEKWARKNKNKNKIEKKASKTWRFKAKSSVDVC